MGRIVCAPTCAAPRISHEPAMYPSGDEWFVALCAVDAGHVFIGISGDFARWKTMQRLIRIYGPSDYKVITIVSYLFCSISTLPGLLVSPARGVYNLTQNGISLRIIWQAGRVSGVEGIVVTRVYTCGDGLMPDRAQLWM